MSRNAVSHAVSGAICVMAGVTIALTATGLTAPSHPPSSPVQYLRPQGSKAPFSAAVRVENVLYLSGQIGAGPDGRLPPAFADQARQTMENVKKTLTDAGSSFNDVFKCTVMLTDMSHWDDFNKIYVTYFAPERLPARSAIGANGLARGAMVELECTAYNPRPQTASTR